LNKSSNAFRASLFRGVVVSRSTVVRGEKNVHPFRALLGETRSEIGWEHSKRLLGSNDTHCAHECSSVPHLAHRSLNPMSSGARFPHWAHRIT